MLQVFIAFIVIGFLVLFLLMSLPMLRKPQVLDEKRKTQPFNAAE